MSTFISVGGSVRVPFDNTVPAVAALTGWSADDVDRDGFGEGNEARGSVEELIQLIEYQGFTEVETAEDGAVTFGHYEGYAGNIEQFLTTLAPFIEPGGWLQVRLQVQSEYDDEPSRWVFDGKTMATERPSILWKSDLLPFLTFATDAQRLSWGDSNDDEIAALRTAVDCALSVLGLPELTDLYDPEEES